MTPCSLSLCYACAVRWLLLEYLMEKYIHFKPYLGHCFDQKAWCRHTYSIFVIEHARLHTCHWNSTFVTLCARVDVSIVSQQDLPMPSMWSDQTILSRCMYMPCARATPFLVTLKRVTLVGFLFELAYCCRLGASSWMTTVYPDIALLQWFGCVVQGHQKYILSVWSGLDGGTRTVLTVCPMDNEELSHKFVASHTGTSICTPHEHIRSVQARTNTSALFNWLSCTNSSRSRSLALLRVAAARQASRWLFQCLRWQFFEWYQTHWHCVHRLCFLLGVSLRWQNAHARFTMVSSLACRSCASKSCTPRYQISFCFFIREIFQRQLHTDIPAKLQFPEFSQVHRIKLMSEHTMTIKECTLPRTEHTMAIKECTLPWTHLDRSLAQRW